MEQKLSNRLSALATDAERCADHYIEKPGYFGPATVIDLYRTIALLARELASALQERVYVMEQMRERELLPCPFCGGAAELFNWATPHSPLWKVGCRSCDAWIDPDQRSIEACHDAWNIRADIQPEIDRRVAEERERLVAVVEAMLATARRGEKTATLETWRHQYKGGIEALEPIVEMLRREAQFEKENSDGE